MWVKRFVTDEMTFSEEGGPGAVAGAKQGQNRETPVSRGEGWEGFVSLSFFPHHFPQHDTLKTNR